MSLPVIRAVALICAGASAINGASEFGQLGHAAITGGIPPRLVSEGG
jgi:hypothetical protein